jgi:hypothetical protein
VTVGAFSEGATGVSEREVRTAKPASSLPDTSTASLKPVSHTRTGSRGRGETCEDARRKRGTRMSEAAQTSAVNPLPGSAEPAPPTLSTARSTALLAALLMGLLLGALDIFIVVTA